MEIEHKKRKIAYKEWRCGSCNKLLGIIYATKTLAIKYKDLTAWVDGEIKIICTFCKSENIYKSKSTIDDLNNTKS
jgi:phage FluMu protein Com